jgi:E3 ubiquitin-protein ligase DOA10
MKVNRNKMEQTCLFCLESAKKNMIDNPVRCQCRIVAHKQCFEEWVESKGHLECPICHTLTFPNPIQPPQVFVIYVNEDTNLSSRKAKLLMSTFLIFLASSATILVYFIVKATE